MKKNEVENKSDEPSFLDIVKSLPVGNQNLLDKDIWDAQQDLGLRINHHISRKTLRFTNIQQPWLKEKLKEYFLIRKIQGMQLNTFAATITIFNSFSKFLSEQYINSFSEINDDILELYLKSVSNRPGLQEGAITYIKKFFDIGNENKWFDISTYFLSKVKPVKRTTKKIKYIPDEVLKQLDDNLYLLPEPLQRLVILIRALGLRASEILQLRFDCLRQRKDGKWEIQFTNWKFKERLDILPINEELVAIIKEQQQYIQDNLGQDYHFLFCARQSVNNAIEEGYISSFIPKPSVMRTVSFNRALNELSAHSKIKDKAGNIWNFTSHQFRRTVATKMTNEQVRHYIIQCYLRHASPKMLQHYAYIFPETMKQEMDKFRKKKKIVDITGREIKQIHPQLDSDLGLQWLRAKMQPKALAMGFCARPALLKPCSHANACMTCDHFRLDEDDLPALKQHLQRNQQLKEESEKLSYIRQIKSIKQDEMQLNKLIQSLEENYE